MHNAEILLSADYGWFYAVFSSIAKRIKITTLKVLTKGGLISTLQPHKYDYICEAPYDECMILFKVYKGYFWGGWKGCVLKL